MLDNLDYIAQIDKNNGLALIAGQAHQLSEKFEVDASAFMNVQNIVVAGMGGSPLPAEFIQTWKQNELPLPLTICREYQLPGFVNEKSLVIISSYSGNTAETLSALDDALDRKVQVVIVTSGGKLLERAQQENIVHIQLPNGLPPRMAVLYGVKAQASLFESMKLVQGWTAELEHAGEWAKDQIASWISSEPTASNPAKQLAGKLLGKIGIFYAGPTLEFIARKWKIDVNENAKNLAFSYTLPEFDHNEFQGWLHPQAAPLAVVEVQSNLDDTEIMKRFEVSNRLLSGNMPQPTIVQAQGESALQQLVWCVLFGGMVSAYLAILNGIDPLPVPLVEKLKVELDHGAD